jgi:hypothetical protein
MGAGPEGTRPLERWRYDQSWRQVMPILQRGGIKESTYGALSPIVGTIDRQMSRLARGTLVETRTVIGELLVSWPKLVELLALERRPSRGSARLQATRNGEDLKRKCPSVLPHRWPRPPGA